MKDLTEKQLRTYKRNHPDGSLLNEESKIDRDKSLTIKAEKHAKKHVDTMQTDSSDEEMEKYLETMHEAKKAAGNARTHQKRLKALSQSDDF